MRLVTYEANGAWRAGIALDGDVVEAVAVAREAGFAGTDGEDGWDSNRRIIAAGPARLRALGATAAALAASGRASAAVHSLEDMRLGPPIVDPDKIICLGLNYRGHAAEASLDAPVAPMLFAKFRNALTGPGAPIIIPRISQQIDYEGELAVVISRPCKEVSEEEALDYVAGVMAFNDVSARDVQHLTSQYTAGKALDTFAPCGPALVLMDEVPDVQDLDLATRVNGQTVQHANTSLMIFSVREIVSFISRLMTLQPGDIIATGTPEGVGFKRTPPLYLRDGDVVEIEIEGVGLLRNPVSNPVLTPVAR